MAGIDGDDVPTKLEPELREMKLEAGDDKMEGAPSEEPVNGHAQPVDSSTSTAHNSRAGSGSQSPVKKEEMSQSPASSAQGEELVGGEITVKMEGKTPKLSRAAARKIAAKPAILYDDLPDCTAEATSSFSILTDSTYVPKYLGDTEHALECDCAEEWDAATRTNNACGEDSDCINRATKMECIGDCGCGADCQNQRFQRKQYASVSVIKTEKKGYGLRANTDLSPNDFIFEYIGEVINELNFHRRTRQYADEGIKHFYFMSLSKGEFVDATRRGNLGRFCNHSCNPNCYVDKWVVGDKLRMGIFAERKIKAGEELVFNYNVDRYGAAKTPCFCGEDNCSGYIGGSKQTGGNDPQLSNTTIEALGLDDYDDWSAATGKKGRKKKIKYEEDDEEYVGNVQPRGLQKEGVSKVMATLKQNKEKWIAIKLLNRIEKVEDEAVIYQVVKTHGYLIMKTVLSQFEDDLSIVQQVLNILDRFPRLSRNKIQDSKIEETIEKLTTSEDHHVAEKASKLLEAWSKLVVEYRIPRMTRDRQAAPIIRDLFDRRKADRPRSRSKSPTTNAPKAPKGPSAISAPTGPKGFQQRPNPQSFPIAPRGPRLAGPPPLPFGWAQTLDGSGKTYYFTSDGQKTQWHRPTEAWRTVAPPPPPKEKTYEQKLADIVAGIEKEKAASASATPTAAATPTVESKDKWRSMSEDKQKKLYKNTLHPHVKHYIDKYKHKLPKDDLKRLGKEITDLITNSDFKHGRVTNPTHIDSKRTKDIRKHLSQYFEKALVKHTKREKERADRKAAKEGKPAPLSTDPSAGNSPVPASPEESPALGADDDVDEIMGSDAGDTSPADLQVSVEGSPGLKRKRNGDQATDGAPFDEDDLSSPKKFKIDTPPPPPPPPPPAEGTPGEPTEHTLNSLVAEDDSSLNQQSFDANKDGYYAKTNGSINTLVNRDRGSPADQSPQQLATPSTTTNGSCDRDTDVAAKLPNGTTDRPVFLNGR